MRAPESSTKPSRTIARLQRTSDNARFLVPVRTYVRRKGTFKQRRSVTKIG
jgi:hypothetical protein